MPEPFDPIGYIGYVASRWRLLLAITLSAALLAAGASALLPKRYTATASILIEPPGTSDPRTATAVSPVYLESLKSYELFASSDTLFARACEKFHLLNPDGPAIETLKRRVLRVNKLKETKILQLSVTLPDPRQAQAVVEYLARQTVDLNQSVAQVSDSKQLAEAQNQAAELRESLLRKRDEASRADGGRLTALSNDVSSLAELKADLERSQAAAEASAAEFAAREANNTGDLAFLRTEAAAQRAKAASLAKRRTTIEAELTAKQTALAALRDRGDRASADLRLVEDAFATASRRASDIKATSGLRGEQLRIIDPGIVPQRPSSPDLPLNVVAALVLALAGSVCWLAVAYSLDRRRPSRHIPLRVASGGDR